MSAAAIDDYMKSLPTPPITKYIAIGGTHSWSDQPGRDWWQRGSAWARYIERFRFERLRNRDFVWEAALDGEQFWRRLLKKGDRDDHRGWRGAAAHVIDYLTPESCPSEFRDRNVFAHSHAGQVMFYACAAGLQIRTLVTIGTPVRSDMQDVIAAGRHNIGFWLHICDTGDRVARWGGLGDGTWRLPWKAKYKFDDDFGADVNCDIDGVEHSRVLQDPGEFVQWLRNGWINMARHANKEGFVDVQFDPLGSGEAPSADGSP